MMITSTKEGLELMLLFLWVQNTNIRELPPRLPSGM